MKFMYGDPFSWRVSQLVTWRRPPPEHGLPSRRDLDGRGLGGRRASRTLRRTENKLVGLGVYMAAGQSGYEHLGKQKTSVALRGCLGKLI